VVIENKEMGFSNQHEVCFPLQISGPIPSFEFFLFLISHFSFNKVYWENEFSHPFAGAIE